MLFELNYFFFFSFLGLGVNFWNLVLLFGVNKLNEGDWEYFWFVY